MLMTLLLGESEQEETRTSEANKMQHRMIIQKTKTISNEHYSKCRDT